MSMGEASTTIVKGRYTYVHDSRNGRAIDVHRVIVARSRFGAYILGTYALLFGLTCSLLFTLLQEMPVAVVLWSFPIAGILLKRLVGKQVEKESIIIFPAFGVQLETCHSSGKTLRRFVPIDKILRPVLNECVTPVTCYWSLSLIIRGEEELLLVFKELHPPLSMLVPIWKALCAATTNEEHANINSDRGTDDQ